MLAILTDKIATYSRLSLGSFLHGKPPVLSVADIKSQSSPSFIYFLVHQKMGAVFVLQTASEKVGVIFIIAISKLGAVIK